MVVELNLVDMHTILTPQTYTLIKVEKVLLMHFTYKEGEGQKVDANKKPKTRKTFNSHLEGRADSSNLPQRVATQCIHNRMNIPSPPKLHKDSYNSMLC